MEVFRVCCVVLALTILRSSTMTAFTIPPKYDGFAFPPQSSKVPVVLESFIDPMCPDCRSAWPTIKALVDLYGSALSVILHPFPVPNTTSLKVLWTGKRSWPVSWLTCLLFLGFHHNSFFAARALHIADSLNVSSTIPLLELIYENQELFANDATKGEAPSDVVQRFISLGVESGLSPHLFWKGFSDSSTDQATRSSFKYGCSRYVTSTPSYLVNGVPAAADETWSIGKWRSILEPLMDGKYSLAVANAVDGEAPRILLGGK